MLQSALKAFIGWLVGLLFKRGPTPEATAQKEKDRADALQSRLDAKNISTATRDAVRAGLRDRPDRLREHDPFERTD